MPERPQIPTSTSHKASRGTGVSTLIDHHAPEPRAKGKIDSKLPSFRSLRRRERCCDRCTRRRSHALDVSGCKNEVSRLLVAFPLFWGELCVRVDRLNRGKQPLLIDEGEQGHGFPFGALQGPRYLIVKAQGWQWQR